MADVYDSEGVTNLIISDSAWSGGPAGDYAYIVAQRLRFSYANSSRVKEIADGSVYTIDDGKFTTHVHIEKAFIRGSSSGDANLLNKILRKACDLSAGRAYLWFLCYDNTDPTHASNYKFYNGAGTSADVLRVVPKSWDVIPERGNTWEFRAVFQEVTM